MNAKELFYQYIMSNYEDNHLELVGQPLYL